MSNRHFTISKTKFLYGTQCAKRLYFDVFRKDLKLPVSPQQQRLFDRGHAIGKLAQDAFPNGVDASPETYYDFGPSIDLTTKLIRSAQPVIYEAAFSGQQVLAALDILLHRDGERHALEVKSTGSVKDYHLLDASLQYWVMHASGFAPDRFFIMHLDTGYVRNGRLDPSALFNYTDITEAVKSRQEWVSNRLEELHAMLQQAIEPDVNIGPHCTAPFECEFKHHCWKHVEEGSVFELTHSRGTDWELYEQGIVSLKEIPDDYPLNNRQQRQVEGAKRGTPYIDHGAIRAFLDKAVYPLHFLDFESINPIVPFMDGTSPFQQIPFQYSCHILASKHGDFQHREFLAKPEGFNVDSGIIEEDPRLELIKSLKKDIGSDGHLVAYNAPFEKSILKALANDFPEEAEFLYQLTHRFIDLHEVFSNGWYYAPTMGGSTSIKVVLPAIAPEFGYEDLAVNNGNDANLIFQAMISGSFSGDEAKTRQQLLDYCKRDTEGMLVIWNALQSM